MSAIPPRLLPQGGTMSLKSEAHLVRRQMIVGLVAAGLLAAGLSGCSLGATPGAAHGARGAEGPIGPRGSQGARGSLGPTGPRGAMGAVGPAGPQGVRGQTGATGLRGPIGATGLAGPTGATGSAGPMGLTGPMGPMGLTGPTGAAGATGATGIAGPQGVQGATGPAGPSDYFTVDFFNGSTLPLGDCSLFVSTSCTPALGSSPPGGTFPATITLDQVAVSSPQSQQVVSVWLMVGGHLEGECLLGPPNVPCTLTPPSPITIPSDTPVYVEFPYSITGEVDVVTQISAVTLP